jgi:hypothetical protein
LISSHRTFSGTVAEESLPVEEESLPVDERVAAES